MEQHHPKGVNHPDAGTARSSGIQSLAHEWQSGAAGAGLLPGRRPAAGGHGGAAADLPPWAGADGGAAVRRVELRGRVRPRVLRLVRVHAGLGQTLLALVPLATLLVAVVASAVCIAQAAVLVRRFPPVHPVTMNAVGMTTEAALTRRLSGTSRSSTPGLDRRSAAKRLPSATRDSASRWPPAPPLRRPRPAHLPRAPPGHETVGRPRRRPGHTAGPGPGGAVHIALGDHDLQGFIGPAEPHRHRVRAAVLTIGRQHCGERSMRRLL